MAKSQKKSQKNIFDKVCDSIRKQKLLPIPVESINSEYEISRYFGGELKDFLEAAKSLGAKSIFVETHYLEEDEFFYDSGMDDEEYLETYGDECSCGNNCKCGCSEEKSESKSSKKSSKSKKSEKSESDEEGELWYVAEDLDGFDLSLLKPEIAKYMEYEGEICGVTLTVPGADHLEAEYCEDWYDDFATLVEEASEMIEDDPMGVVESIKETFEADGAEDDAEEPIEDNSIKKIAAHPPKKTGRSKKK